MMIRNLELHNFLSHENSVVSFDQGVNIIVGQNGAGKSSIIDAIKFALFGDRRGDSIADLVKRGKDNMTVSLEFSTGGDDYRITRMLTMGKNDVRNRDASLLRNGTEIARTVKEVNSAIEDTLGINKELFRNSVFVEQGEIATLVSEEKAKREETFGKILGLNLLSQYADDLGKLARETEMHAGRFAGVSDNIDQVNAELSGLTSDRSEIEARVSAFERQKNDLESDLTTADAERTALRNEVSRLVASAELAGRRKKLRNELAGKISGREAKIRELRLESDKLNSTMDSSLLKKSREIESYFTVAERINDRTVALRDIDSTIRKISEMQASMEKLRGDHETYVKLDSRRNDLRSDLHALEEDSNRYRQTLARVEELQKELDAVKSRQGSQLTVIKQKLGRQDISAETLGMLKTSAQNELRECESRIGEFKASAGSIFEQRKELSGKLSSIQGLTRCPLCLQPLTAEHLESIKNEYSRNDMDLLNKQNNISTGKTMMEARKKKILEELDFLDSRMVSDFIMDLQTVTKDESNLLKFKETLDSLRERNERYVSVKTELDQVERQLSDLKENDQRFRSMEMSLGTQETSAIGVRRAEIEKSLKELNDMRKSLTYSLGFAPDAGTREKMAAMKGYEGRITELTANIATEESLKQADVELLASAVKEIEDLEAMVSGLPDLRSRAGIAEERYNSLSVRLREAIAVLSGAQADMKSVDGRILEHRENIKRLTEEKEKMETLKKAVLSINALRGCFDREGIQKAIRKDSAVFITNKMREYSFAFNLNFDDVRVSEDMGIEVSQNGSLESVDMLSGGEKTALAIALRLALAKYVMENIKTMIMDEPTTFLDQDRRQNLKDIIQYTFRGEDNPVPQMIIVTHHTELISVADNVNEVVKRNGTSEVKVVS
ncbi:MAG: AAA family ATPase [Candidatus Thermoplasmatota archaeon]|nr:AAA family ATPase [Candidatus Thermoplasmatota archaeon]